ncbi:MAG: MBL fold metallo-hydrolase [Planctomycetes bacterium]|nr:MBL fold metallo-hydrolase [Planctomycetota bacterium]
MREIAPDVWQLAGFPPHAINIYLVGDVLIDAGTRWSPGRIGRQLEDQPIRLLALTHVHPDHQGAARWVCERYGAPLACHADDRPTMEGTRPMLPANRFIALSTAFFAGPPRPVTRELKPDDEVAGFRVLHLPGHTPGHVVFFRERDRVAIVGDVLNGMNLLTTMPGLHEPPSFFCTDPAENRRSIRRLVELKPSLLCFGHGPPLSDMAQLGRFVERLAD